MIILSKIESLKDEELLKATMNREQAIEELCAPGQPYELKVAQIRGHAQRVFVSAPPTLRELYAENRSDRDFLVYAEQRMSFEQVYCDASALASAMVDSYGIQSGDRVAIAMRNYPEWVVSFFAATSIGAVVVAVNALWTGKEQLHALNDSEPKLLIADQERLDSIAACTSTPTALEVIRVRANENSRLSSDLWDEVLASRAGAVMPPASIDPDDDATILYTSGSTGSPKGAISSHRNITHALLSWELDWQLRTHMGIYEPPVLDHQEGILLTVPLFHVAGAFAALLASIRPQRKVVCMYKWDVQQAMALIERERLTVLTATSTITGDFVHAAESTDRDISSLHVLGGGGAARAPEQVQAIDQMSKSVIPHTGWGMTETTAIGTSIAGEYYLQRPGCSGQRSAVLDIRAVDEEGNVCIAGERGELQVRGTSIFRGYWNRADDTAEAFDGEWFRTGDAAVINDEGYCYIVDRIKDLVIRGGENIGCGTVEAALVEHPNVIEACAYGVPDDRLGEEVGATLFVSSAIAEDELRKFLSNRLARFEIPRYIHQQAEVLPRGFSGKISKQQLKTEAIARLGLNKVST